MKRFDTYKLNKRVGQTIMNATIVKDPMGWIWELQVEGHPVYRGRMISLEDAQAAVVAKSSEILRIPNFVSPSAWIGSFKPVGLSESMRRMPGNGFGGRVKRL
jgi:hypothetical protein